MSNHGAGSRPPDPAKTSFRSEPTDFQRGEIEIDGHNLYFNEWSYDFQVETETGEWCQLLKPANQTTAAVHLLDGRLKPGKLFDVPHVDP